MVPNKNISFDEKKLSKQLLEFVKPIRMVCAKQFPKKCGNCATVYPDFKAYVRGTEPIGVPGTFSEGDDPFGVLSYVNCSCKSTLLLHCEDMSGENHQRFAEALASEASRLGVSQKDILLALRTLIREALE